MLSVITPSGSKSARVLVKGKCSEKKGKKRNNCLRALRKPAFGYKFLKDMGALKELASLITKIVYIGCVVKEPGPYCL